MRRSASSLGFVVLLALTACRPAQQPREDWSGFGRLENVLNWTPEQQLRGYRHMDRIYPTRAIPASQRPFPLPDKPADFSSFRYAVGSENYGVGDFVAHNHVVGLLAIHDGSVAIERYAEGNTRDTRWYSFSVAKSVVSMLVGAAIKDGFIQSVDARVSDYLPVLKGSAYDAVTLRQAMTMSSGVAWDEDYANPQSDIAQTGGSALDRLHYLLRKPEWRRPAPRSTTTPRRPTLWAPCCAQLSATTSRHTSRTGSGDVSGWSAIPTGCCSPNRVPSTEAAA
jgi:CubicO group peptidase (beta-lactamase class C family)